RCLAKLRRMFPGCYEIVYSYSSSVVVSFSMSERGYEGIVTLTASRSDVRLYVDKTLPDPKGILAGSGGKLRHAAVSTASVLDRGDIQTLVKAAIKHANAALPRTGSTHVIIKSGSKKRAK